MIPEAVDRLQEALIHYVNPAVVFASQISILREAPDTAAGPVVWIDLDSVRYGAGVYRVGLRARCMVGDARETVTRQRDLRLLAEMVIAGAVSVGVPADVEARAGTVRIGETSYPTMDVTITLAATGCDLPDPYFKEATRA